MTTTSTTLNSCFPSSRQQWFQEKRSFCLSSLKTCSNMQDLRQIHAQIITTGLVQDSLVYTDFLRFCSLSPVGDTDYAYHLVSSSDAPSVFSLNLVIRGLASSSTPETCLLLYERMITDGSAPNHYTYPFLLKACASHLGIKEGKEIHGRLLKSGLELNLVTQNCVTHFYLVCGFVDEARRVFEKMPQTNVVVWSTMINGYARNGQSREALGMFVQMLDEDFRPNEATIMPVLSASGHLGDLLTVRWVHCLIGKLGIGSSVVLSTSLIYSYCKCGDLGAAIKIFSRMPKVDTIACNALISGLVSNGLFGEGLRLFEDMVNTGLHLEAPSFICAFKACTGLGDFEKAKEVYAVMKRCDIKMSATLTSSIIDMYMKFGEFEMAKSLFKGMAHKDIVVWTSMISGYTQNGFPEEALSMFHQMIEANIKPNDVTLTSIVSACTQLESLALGTVVHNYIKEHLKEPNLVVYNALVDLYAKCGCIKEALQIFQEMPKKDTSSWNTIISSLARHGATTEALSHFELMVKEGISPNTITFVSVLSTCCHGGLVDLGRHYFKSMSSVYGVEPGLEHFACMVDLLGRAGLLKEAEVFIDSMPITADGVVWGALLAACRVHKNVAIAERVVKKLVQLEPDADGPFVLLSKIYEEADRWEDSENVRRLMEGKGIRKRPGYSWIEVDGEVHLFFAGDKSNTCWTEMHNTLDSINKQLQLYSQL